MFVPPPWQLGAGLRLIEPPPAGLTCVVSAKHAVKFAVTLLAPVMLTVTGLAAPVASPLQLLNLYPVAGLAVSWTFVPCVYLVGSTAQLGAGEAATEPLPAGATLVESA